MSDIELVIKIPEEMYKWVYDVNRFDEDYGVGDFMDLVKDGIPLPKGHGKLIDVKQLRQDIIAHKYSIDFCKEHNIEQSINVGILNILLADAPTIIEADKSESEE